MKSLGLKLLLVTGVPLLFAVGILLVVSYEVVRSSAMLIAEERILDVAEQLRDLTESSVDARLESLELEASRPIYADYLRGTASGEAGDTLAVRVEAVSAVALMELRNGTGDVVVARGDTAVRREGLLSGVASARTFNSRLAVVDDSTVVYFVSVPVARDDSTFGHLVEWRTSRVSQSGAALERLLGTDITFAFGNLDGGLLFSSRGAATWPFSPGDTLAKSHVYSIGTEAYLGIAAAMPKTPWALLVQTPLESVLASARRFILRMSGFSLMVLFLGLGAAWAAGQHLIRPLRRMTEAVAEISEGYLTRRVGLHRTDEIGLLANGIDEMAARIQKSQDSLEARVAERTEKLEDALESVRSSQQQAVKANRAKSEFLAKMSHELRTPLNAIIGFSDLMLEGRKESLTEGQERRVRNIRASGTQLLTLINEILDISRIEAGGMNLERSDVDVAGLLRDVQAMTASLAVKKGLDLSVDVAPEVGSVNGDPVRLKQILLNLVGNAIKFTPSGGRVQLQVMTAGDFVWFAVSDTGKGIASEDQDRIFDEFEQVGHAEGGEPGTGLGLALAKRLVELHGGTIGVESELGRGATFRFSIPRVFSSVKPLAQELSSGEEDDPAASEGKQVLVIEDDERAAAILRSHLESAGFAVRHARTGAEGLELAAELRPDVITLDILLPDYNGNEVLLKLRSEEATRAIPVVVVSVTGEKEVGLSLGVEDWLVKPVSRARIEDAVSNALRSGPIQSTAARILVVDDDPIALELVREALVEHGYRVTTVPSGSEALQEVRTDPPDLLILDLVMPGMTGGEVLKRLRNDGLMGFPVLVFTEKDLTREEVEQFSSGAAAVIPKNRGWAALVSEASRLVTNS